MDEGQIGLIFQWLQGLVREGGVLCLGCLREKRFAEFLMS